MILTVKIKIHVAIAVEPRCSQQIGLIETTMECSNNTGIKATGPFNIYFQETVI